MNTEITLTDVISQIEGVKPEIIPVTEEIALVRSPLMPFFAFLLYVGKMRTTRFQLSFVLPGGSSRWFTVPCTCCMTDLPYDKVRKFWEEFNEKMKVTCAEHGIDTIFIRRAEGAWELAKSLTVQDDWQALEQALDKRAGDVGRAKELLAFVDFEDSRLKL